MARTILMQKRVDETIGRRYGRLVVLSVAGKDKSGYTAVLCRCDCGSEKIIRASSVKNGSIQSCGCLGRERRRAACIRASTKHGLSNSPEHIAWMAMKQRCYDHNHSDYHLYGGRGIKVCDSWRDSFSQFLKDVGNKPSAKHSLDRFPDLNGDYKPGNVRWATACEQANNTRSNVLVNLNGEAVTLVEASRRTGISTETIRRRMRRGLPIDRRISNGPRPREVCEKVRQGLLKYFARKKESMLQLALDRAASNDSSPRQG